MACQLYPDLPIRIWNLQEKRLESILEGHTGLIEALVLTSDNKYIVSSSRDKTTRVWSLHDKVQVAIFHSDTGTRDALALTTDNKYIVKDSYDCALKIWKTCSNFGRS